MKNKIVFFLIIVFVFLLYIPSVKADMPEVFNREEKENLGVNKKWKITDKNINYVKSTFLVDPSKKIYDFSDILTNEEEKELYERIIPLIEEYKMDIVILTYSLPYTNDSQNEDFACDFYDFNDFGIDFKSYSGILLFRNTYEQDPYFDMYSFGEAQLYFDGSRMSNILDDIYNQLHNGEYNAGFNSYLDYVISYHNKGMINGYYVDENSILRKKFNPLIPLNIIISGIITTVFILVNVKKNKMVMLKTDASSYLNKESFKIINQSDTFVRSHISSWTESTSSGGGRGGHSSIGHSGGGHTSGGGRHG